MTAEIKSKTKVGWDEITREQLKNLIIDEELSNSSIARMFGVTVSKVQYKKTKFNLIGVNILYEKFAKANKELFDDLNGKSREWLLDSQNIDLISKAITQFIFRDGPIEDVHSKCRDFTENDMKKINIEMVNHVAGLLTYASAGNWLQLRVLLEYFNKGCSEWYPAEAETSKIDTVFFRNLNLSGYNPQ